MESEEAKEASVSTVCNKMKILSKKKCKIQQTKSKSTFIHTFKNNFLPCKNDCFLFFRILTYSILVHFNPIYHNFFLKTFIQFRFGKQILVSNNESDHDSSS